MRSLYAARLHQARGFFHSFPAPPIFRSIAEMLFRTTRNFALNEGSHMAAGVAYYAIFSLFPLMLATIAVTEYFIHSADLQQDVVHFIDRQLPGHDHDYVEDHLEDLQAARSALGAIAMVGLVWAGRAVFGAVRRVVNRAWKIAERPHFLIDQLAQIAASVGAVLLFISAAVAGSVGRTVASETDLLPVTIPWGLFFSVLPFLVSLGLFVLVYRMLPDTDVRWRDAIIPGVVAALALELTKLLFSILPREPLPAGPGLRQYHHGRRHHAVPLRGLGDPGVVRGVLERDQAHRRGPDAQPAPGAPAGTRRAGVTRSPAEQAPRRDRR